MTSRLLTDEERNRFATYCEQEAQSSKMFAEQLDKMSGPQYEVIAKHLRTEASAFAIVANKLRTLESMSIG